MLRTFHRLQRYLAYFVLVSALALAFSGFGFNYFGSAKTPAAIHVNDKQMSYEEFHQEARALEERYRTMFGKSYESLVEQFNINVNQQISDRFIQETLTNALATSLGMQSGEQEFKAALKNEVFSQGYSEDMYRNILAASGLTQEQFEQQIKDSVKRSQLLALLKDSAIPSPAEIEYAIRRDESQYKVSYIEFSPSSFIKDVQMPTEQEVEEYYTNNQSEFERAPRVRYDYTVIAPEQFLQKVQVSDDEVELVYTDNIGKYSTPARVKAKHIQLNYPVEKDTAKMAAVREKAQEVLAKAQAGENFDSLVMQYSDDITTKTLGGDLGWLGKGSKSKEFDEVVFGEMQGEGIAPLISTDYGFHIVKVESRKASEPKKLDEVRGEIVKELQSRDAPSYAADKARELYDLWTKNKGQLADLVKNEGLVIATTNGLLSKEVDPETTLKGLTEQVLEYQDNGPALLVELGALSVLVQVQEKKEVEIAPLAEVSAAIKEKLIAQRSVLVAKERATNVITEAKGDGAKIFTAPPKEVKVKEVKDLTALKAGEKPLNDARLRKAIFSSSVKAGDVLDTPFQIDGAWYVVRVAGITPPSESVIAEKRSSYRERVEKEIADNVVASLLEREKAKATIDISPSVLAK